MFKKIFQVFCLAAFTLGIGGIASSCSDDPEKAHDERHEKDHDEPAMAVVKLVPGHFHGVRFHQDPVIPGAKYLKTIQEAKFKYIEGQGWKLDPASDQFFVVMASYNENISTPYGMWITYYNEKGEEMNHSIVEGGQDKAHQHFFHLENTTDGSGQLVGKQAEPWTEYGKVEAGDNVTTNLFTYTYMDTDPWNKTLNDAGTKLTGDSNPVGFKGWFNFLRPFKKFNLQIELMHAKSGSKFSANNVASPFHTPSPLQRQKEEFEVNMVIPVYVLHSKSLEENGLWADEYDPAELTQEEKVIIKGIAQTYHITEAEAYKVIIDRINAISENGESGTLWF